MESPDFLVIGAGVAGLRAAIELSQAGKVLVVAKDSLRESFSEYAQGGIAVALSDDDEVELHEQDTIAAGAGLCDREAVRTLVEEGPAASEQLIEWGAEFDRDGMRLAFTREAAHSRSRILHAQGDSGGHEIGRALYRRASSLAGVAFRSFRATVDLSIEDGEAVGALIFDGDAETLIRVRARAVLLATGGLGRVFKETTNPDVATGDGVGMAFRAGAEIGDLEFVQFHPTALHVEGAPRFLLSEALRGEGAFLRNTAGERFTDALARRDVIAREAAPVHPAAHSSMGGVRADRDGRTSIPRLYAAGEVASTGVQGANRLASNSLLEGLVFGARGGAAMREQSGAAGDACGGEDPPSRTPEEQVGSLAWDLCGIVRSGETLSAACRQLQAYAMYPAPEPSLAMCELRSQHTVALLIARCALAREESRGAHLRLDFPAPRQEFEKHSVVARGNEVRFR